MSSPLFCFGHADSYGTGENQKRNLVADLTMRPLVFLFSHFTKIASTRTALFVLRKSPFL